MMADTMKVQRSQADEYERLHGVFDVHRLDRFVAVRALRARTLADVEGDDSAAIVDLTKVRRYAGYPVQ